MATRPKQKIRIKLSSGKENPRLIGFRIIESIFGVYVIERCLEVSS